MTTTPAQAEPVTPPSSPAVPNPAEPADQVPPAKRDKVLQKNWRSSKDRIWTTTGDANGFHVLTATAKTGYQWETAASLSEPGFDVDLWIGNACATESGRRVVVVYGPRTFTNKADLFDRGGFTAVVDLVTHEVKKLPVQSSLAYFNPGCGAGEKAVISQFDGERREDPKDTTTQSRLFTVDAAARTLSKPILLNTELSSPVPVRDGGITAAAAGGLVTVSPAGKLTRTASATGVPFRLVPDAAGGVVFMDKAGEQVRVRRAVGKAVTELASGPANDVGVTRGDAGRVFITGEPAKVAKLPSGVQKIAVPRESVVSTRGDLALTKVKEVGAHDPRTDTVDPTVAKDVVVSATVVATGESLTFEVSPAVIGAEAIAGRAVHPELGTAATAKTQAKSLAQAGSPTDPVEDERYCSVARNDVRNQAVQPKPRNVEWAVDQAIVGKLNQAASRPANWKGYGMPAYSPQTLFPAPALLGGGRVPAQIMLGIIAQESNMWQASKYALPGVAANPLMGNYYGRDIYNSNTADDWDIKWTDADCGYGLTQATDGMRMLGKEKTDDKGNKVEVALPYETQRAVAVDYAANIAYGLRILQDKWNQTYAAGLKVHNADPSAIENWFFAVWAYNSGFYPNKNDGQPWGVGWLNNPINPRYDQQRHPFMTLYEDAKNPQRWPYPEKVMGWAANPITMTESPGVEKAGYNYAWWSTPTDKLNVKPPKELFCTAENNCYPGVAQQPNAPGMETEKPGPCLHTNAAGQYDLKCWAHSPVSWQKVNAAGACTSCGHEQLRFDPGYPWCSTAGQTGCESDGISYPVYCDQLAGLSESSVVVDDVPADAPTPRGCAEAPRRAAGSFNLSFSGAGDGTYPSKIDFHQVGGGYRGHYWRASTRTPGTEGGKLEVTGTWRLGGYGAKKMRVQVFVPEFGAWTEQAKYTIHLGNGQTRYRVLNQTWQQNRWIDLGTFDFKGDPAVSLTTEAKDGTGDDSIIFDAVAFTLAGAPAYGEENDLWPEDLGDSLPDQVHYVAMGDSYASGEGLAPYDRNSDLQRTNGTKGSKVNACHRSQGGAYPSQAKVPGDDAWGLFGNADDHLPVARMVQQHNWGSFGFIACSGAKTTSVTRDAVNSPPAASDSGGHTDWGSADYAWGELTQVEQGWLDPETTHVSISIGGNDVRFAEILRGCIATLGKCSDTDYKLTRDNGKVDPEALRDYETKMIRDWLPAKLKATYRAIHRAAPNAAIYVMGYPQLFPIERANEICWGLNSEDRLFLNALAGRLSIAIAHAVDQVKAEGVNIRWIDASKGISVADEDDEKKWACGGDDDHRWVNGVTSKTTDGSGESTPGTGTFHPTSAGQKGLANLLSNAFGEDQKSRSELVTEVKEHIIEYANTRWPTDNKGRWRLKDEQAQYAAERCVDLARRGGAVPMYGDYTPCLMVPILFPTAFSANGAARNDEIAIQANPPWVQLRYVSGANEKKWTFKTKKWFEKVMYGQTTCPTPRTSGMECDEFPFYTSEEGGAWDFWTGGENSPLTTRLAEVPEEENGDEGSMVGGMYTACKMRTATYTHVDNPDPLPQGQSYFWNQRLTSGDLFLTIPLTDASKTDQVKTFYVC
ncbi:golvesin C-terminal-like domain-containing protein [Actinoplanes subglobosus]|uniref:SGNH hydrolase-type esterase domain-containing protein n=1 Tax=Actinoplanes subglobosus TaxID=1547892 RepID=A0ABV8IQF3_9ACTN